MESKYSKCNKFVDVFSCWKNLFFVMYSQQLYSNDCLPSKGSGDGFEKVWTETSKVPTRVTLLVTSYSVVMVEVGCWRFRAHEEKPLFLFIFHFHLKKKKSFSACVPTLQQPTSTLTIMFTMVLLYYCWDMSLPVRILSWALIFILRLRFPLGKSLVTILTCTFTYTIKILNKQGAN